MLQDTELKLPSYKYRSFDEENRLYLSRTNLISIIKPRAIATASITRSTLAFAQCSEQQRPADTQISFNQAVQDIHQFGKKTK